MQRRERGAGEVADDAIRQAAREGVAGTSERLPHLEGIHSLFGRHDVSFVKAYTGGQAAAATRAMGADAYAMGDSVVFGRTPDLRTAAHEAAHVVQQRGGVRFSGGVGRPGDRYEQNADAVADAVVGGRSAEALLDRYAGPDVRATAPATAPVQGKFRLSAEQAAATTTADASTVFWRQEEGEHNYLAGDGSDRTRANLQGATMRALEISDDGHLAIEAAEHGAKMFYAESADVDDYNAQLNEVKSSFRLVKHTNRLRVRALDDTSHDLVAVTPENVKNGTSALDMTGPEQCIEMAESVISDQKGDAYRTWLINVAADNIPEIGRESISGRIAALVGQYAVSRRDHTREDAEVAAKEAASYPKSPNVPHRQIRYKTLRVTLRDALPATQQGLAHELNQYRDHGRQLFKPYIAEPNDPQLLVMVLNATRPSSAYAAILSEAPFGPYIKDVSHWIGPDTKAIAKDSKGYTNEPEEDYKPRLLQAVNERSDAVVARLQELAPEDLATALRELKLNEYVELEIGQAFGITSASLSTAAAPAFPYHWAGVVARRGHDVITLENFARHDGATTESDSRWYFGMYGPLKVANVSDTGEVSENEAVDPEHWKKGTFHGAWKAEFGDDDGVIPFTVGVGTKAG